MIATKQLSVIIPVFNEKSHIKTLLDSIIPKAAVDLEIFLVDGGSRDGTVEIINDFSSKYDFIHLVHNPHRYVSHGFNIAFPKTSGKYITLMGAHAVYPPDIFSNAVKYLDSGECDVVGGTLKQEGKTDTGKAIAYAMSSKFGVGGTEFRTEKKKMYVDSVAFAFYKREIFEKTGLLDEELIRNQDDELHYRINAAGYRILMVPEMESTYFVRESIVKLFRQYYQYGYYKPLVLKKVKSGIRLRHLIPACFVIYFLSLFIGYFYPLWLLPLCAYLVMLLSFSLLNRNSLKVRLLTLPAFLTLHISYGIGFIRGLKFLF